MVKELEKTSVWAVVRNNKNEFLILKRSKNANNSGQWNFPGGTVDEGENPSDTISREFHEECGVEIKRWIKMFFVVKNGKKFVFYRPLIIPKIGNLYLNHESSKWQWVKFPDLDHYNLHDSIAIFRKAVKDRQNLKFRKNLVSSSLFVNVYASFDDGDNIGHATICLPTRKLHNFSIIPEYRSLGYAKALMDEIMKLKEHPVQLTANSENNSSLTQKQLVDFYSSYGFVPMDNAIFGPTRMMLKGE